MKSYNVKNPVKCQVFHDAYSYGELLAGITKWWEDVKGEVPTLEAIVFHIDDDLTYNAEVYWFHG